MTVPRRKFTVNQLSRAYSPADRQRFQVCVTRVCRDAREGTAEFRGLLKNVNTVWPQMLGPSGQEVNHAMWSSPGLP